jgi:hypothetical protein
MTTSSSHLPEHEFAVMQIAWTLSRVTQCPTTWGGGGGWGGGGAWSCRIVLRGAVLVRELLLRLKSKKENMFAYFMMFEPSHCRGLKIDTLKCLFLGKYMDDF